MAIKLLKYPDGEEIPNTDAESAPVSIDEAVFNPQAQELVTTWHSNVPNVYCVNAYPNGITFSVHTREDKLAEAAPSQFHLRFRDTRDYLMPEGRYYLHKEDYREGLERRLSQLQEQGRLQASVLYFGTTVDPFLPFQKKFDVTMACLSLFEQYRPGLLVVQTRVPLVIASLPTLKVLGKQAVVSMPIETRLDSVINRYTPGQPRIMERLIAANGLRKQGITLNLMASPILPYGDSHRETWDFAGMLDNHADFITFGCLACGSPDDEGKLRNLTVAKKLVTDKKYSLLRPYSYRNLYYALKVLCPEKLLVPNRTKNQPEQLDMFAA
jgi:hypothetical protein